MALWAIRESQKKLDKVRTEGRTEGRVQEIDVVLTDDSFFDLSPEEQRAWFERRKSKLREESSR